MKLSQSDKYVILAFSDRLLTVQAKQTGFGKNRRGNELAGFEMTFTIKRSEFGMTFMLNGLSDEVKLIVSLEAVDR